MTEVLEIFEIMFLSFLPIIGVTALSIIMVKVRIYWMEKNGMREPEKEILLNGEKVTSVY